MRSLSRLLSSDSLSHTRAVATNKETDVLACFSQFVLVFVFYSRHKHPKEFNHGVIFFKEALPLSQFFGTLSQS